MKTLTSLLVASIGLHTESYLLMTSCVIVVIYLMLKK